MKPTREHATNNAQTYFVTSDTWERRALFCNEAWARLFFKNLLSHRGESYLLHEFVLMPDHFHLLISPTISLERAIQLIKGGFSYRAKKELGSNAEVWHRGFSDHRIRDAEDFEKHVHYIRLNPVKKHLCAAPEEYRFSSAYPGWKLDPIPQWLKPPREQSWVGTAEAVPFQNSAAAGGRANAVSCQNDCTASGTTEAVPFQNKSARVGAAEAVPCQDNCTASGAAEMMPFQSLSTDGAILKGHDFSRANQASPKLRALAPEGGER